MTEYPFTVMWLFGAVIVFLAVVALYWHRQAEFYRHRSYTYRARLQSAEMQMAIRQQEYDTMLFLRDEAAQEELTPAEIQYLHRTLGLKPPA